MYPQIFNYKTVWQVQCRASTFSQFRLSLIILNKLQSVINIMGKSDIWTVLCFYPFPPLKNIEKQWAKVASSSIMGSRYRRGGEGGFLTHLNILSMTFEIYKKKKKMRFYACCFKKLKCTLMNPIMLWCTLSWTKWQQKLPKWRAKCRNNVFKLLLSGTCWKRVITSTQWQILRFG